MKGNDLETFRIGRRSFSFLLLFLLLPRHILESVSRCRNNDGDGNGQKSGKVGRWNGPCHAHAMWLYSGFLIPHCLATRASRKSRYRRRFNEEESGSPPG